MEEVRTNAIDPVCGMSVDPVKAKATTEHNGQTYYFCCTGCATKFQADPEGTLKAKPKRMSHAPSTTVQLGAIKPAGVAQTANADSHSDRAQTRAHQPNSKDERWYVCPMCPEVRHK